MAQIKIGEILERGEWVRGVQEAPAACKRLTQAFLATEELYDVDLQPLNFEILDLDNERVPDEPPDSECRGMLVCWAEVKVKILAAGFSADLGPSDLERLRAITRLSHREARPIDSPLTDAECDEIIDAIAPTTAENIVREAVDTRMIN